MDELRWDDLRVFLAVADEGTLARAAARLGVNASTAHRRVAALEEAMEAALFHRDPRGYSLTEVGEALVPHARDVEESVMAARRAVVGHDRSASGPVTLTMPETLVAVIAPALLSLRGDCPGLHPIVRADDRRLDLGREADVALRPGNHPPDDAVGRKVGVIGWAVYAPKKPVRGARAAGRWCVYSDRAGPVAARAWRLRHHRDVPILAEVDTVGSMHRVLASTRAATGLLPCYVGDADPALRRVEVVDEADTDLWMLVHADLRRSARVRALLDHLAPYLTQLGETLRGR